MERVTVVLRWLAHFHARYMNSTQTVVECEPIGLATRPEELQNEHAFAACA